MAAVEFESKLLLLLHLDGWIRREGVHTGISADGIFGIQLIRYIAVIFSGPAFTNSRFHESRERGQYIYGWIDTLVVQLTINEDLTLSDITG
jgi:hypothetical protein